MLSGMPKQGGMGRIYPPNNLAVYPPIIWMGVQYIWAKIGKKVFYFWWRPFFFFLVFTWTWGKVFYFWWRPFFWSSPEFGGKSVLFLMKTFFMVVTWICGKKVFHLHLFWSSLNFQTWTKSWSRFIPTTLKIGQNWGKIANYPPQCSTKIGTTACYSSYHYTQIRDSIIAQCMKSPKILFPKCAKLFF